MASFTVADYKKKRPRHPVTFHCEVDDRVEVLYLPGPTSYYGTVSRVTASRCVVEFDNGDFAWIRRYGEEAKCIKKTTAPPDYKPPLEEPKDLSDFSWYVAYRFEPRYSDSDE